MKRLTSLVFIISLPFLYSANVHAATDSSAEFDSAKQEIEKSQQDVKKAKRRAEMLEDKNLVEFFSSLEKFLDINATCFDETDKDEVKAGVCILSETQKLADAGNVVAQHGMGNIYEEMGNYDKAISWYQKALDNPKLHELYKSEVESDMDRAKAKVKDKPKEKEKEKEKSE